MKRLFFVVPVYQKWWSSFCWSIIIYSQLGYPEKEVPSTGAVPAVFDFLSTDVGKNNFFVYFCRSENNPFYTVCAGIHGYHTDCRRPNPFPSLQLEREK